MVSNLNYNLDLLYQETNFINNTFIKLFYTKLSKDSYKCKLCSSNIHSNNLLSHKNCINSINLNSNSIIHQIIHLSDIHIRINSRYDEYNHVFNNLYDSLTLLKQDNKNRLIVICGDLLHSKSSLSPECILMAWNFLYKLSSFYPVILIAGNHDAILNNYNRIDSITAILKDRCLDISNKDKIDNINNNDQLSTNFNDHKRGYNCFQNNGECYIYWPYYFPVAEALRDSFYIPSPPPP